MFGRIAYTWQLMGASWQILKQDKKLIILPLLSGICCLLVMASFALPMFFTGHWQPPARNAAPAQQVAYYVVLFLFYFCNYVTLHSSQPNIRACDLRQAQQVDTT